MLCRLAVAIKASSVARSLNLKHVGLGYYLDCDHHERPGVVNLGLFVGVDLNMWPTVCVAIIVLTTDVK